MRSDTSVSHFCSYFCATPSVCATLWVLIPSPLPAHSSNDCFLWGFLFRKVYSSESVHAAMLGVDEKTFRTWAWFVVEMLAAMQLVS